MVVHRSVLIIDERQGDDAFFYRETASGSSRVFVFFQPLSLAYRQEVPCESLFLDRKLQFAETLVHRSLLVVVKGFVHFTFPGWLVVFLPCRRPWLSGREILNSNDERVFFLRGVRVDRLQHLCGFASRVPRCRLGGLLLREVVKRCQDVVAALDSTSALQRVARSPSWHRYVQKSDHAQGFVDRVIRHL